MSKIALVAALLAVVVAPATSIGMGKSVSGEAKSVIDSKCIVGRAGWEGSCADPVGDVKGGPGPDITRVVELQWGVILFKVTFAKAPALAHSSAFKDVVSISIAATHQTTTKHYILSLSANDLTHEVLRKLPDGKPKVLAGLRHVGKTVILGVNLHLLGDPGIVTYRVKASRVMVDGTPGGTDYVPNTGLMAWRDSM